MLYSAKLWQEKTWQVNVHSPNFTFQFFDEPADVHL